MGACVVSADLQCKGHTRSSKEFVGEDVPDSGIKVSSGSKARCIIAGLERQQSWQFKH